MKRKIGPAGSHGHIVQLKLRLNGERKMHQETLKEKLRKLDRKTHLGPRPAFPKMWRFMVRRWYLYAAFALAYSLYPLVAIAFFDHSLGGVIPFIIFGWYFSMLAGYLYAQRVRERGPDIGFGGVFRPEEGPDSPRPGPRT